MISPASSQLDKYVKYEYDEYDYSITFIIQLPNEGQFGLDLYARDPEYQTEKRTMSHCCKYIINYSKSTTVDKPSTNTQLYHDYSFDNNAKEKYMSPRVNQPEQSLSPRKMSLMFIDRNIR